MFLNHSLLKPHYHIGGRKKLGPLKEEVWNGNLWSNKLGSQYEINQDPNISRP